MKAENELEPGHVILLRSIHQRALKPCLIELVTHPLAAGSNSVCSSLWPRITLPRPITSEADSI